jgi:predicted nucleotidyltransferase component of viral defense system
LNERYLNLYALQDKILKFVDQRESSFFLGGGTALSRFYYHHRYSDDLDFFALDGAGFIDNVQALYEQLDEAGYQVETFGVSQKYARFNITDVEDAGGEAGRALKVDFINASSRPRFGELKTDKLFSKIDNPGNILSEKITFIHNKVPRDIADIWIICRNLSFEWAEIITEANQKRASDPLFTADMLRRFQPAELEKVKWIKPVRLEDFPVDREIIIEDIITKSRNRLHK